MAHLLGFHLNPPTHPPIHNRAAPTAAASRSPSRRSSWRASGLERAELVAQRSPSRPPPGAACMRDGHKLFCLTDAVGTRADMLALPVDQLLEPCDVCGDTATCMPFVQAGWPGTAPGFQAFCCTATSYVSITALFNQHIAGQACRALCNEKGVTAAAFISHTVLSSPPSRRPRRCRFCAFKWTSFQLLPV